MEALGREAFKEIAPGDLRPCLFWLAWRSVETRPRMLVSALALLLGPWKLTQYPQMLFLTTTYPSRVLVGGYESWTVYLWIK